MGYSIEEAKEIIERNALVLNTEEISLKKSYGQVLAEDIAPKEPIPSSSISLMDGYALRSLDTIHPPSSLLIIGRITAGEALQRPLKKGEAFSIMTGALLPEGADAVEKKERATREGDRILLKRFVKKGQHIALPGAHLKEGEPALFKGERISALLYNLLSQLKKERVFVYKKPRVAILTTGNELVEVGESFSSHQQINSNAYLLEGLVRESGGIPAHLGVARDNRKEIAQSLKRSRCSDLIITTGGIGEGDHDQMLSTWGDLKVTPLLKDIEVRPGRRLLYGLYGERPIFSLPGSPGAILVFFLELIRPLLSKMQGREKEEYGIGALTKPIQNRKEGALYQMGKLREREGILFVEPMNGSFLSSSKEATLLFRIPEGADLQEGDRVKHLRI